MAEGGNTTEHVVRVSADTSDLNQGLDESSQRLSKFEQLSKKVGEVASSAWNRMKGGVDKVKNSFKNVGTVVSSIVNRFKSLTKATDSVKNAVNKMSEKLTSIFSELKSMLNELLISILFENIEENFNKIIEMSPRFNKAVSSILDSMKTLGAQIVATLEPALTSLAPLVSTVTDALTNAVNVVSQFVARLAGSETYVKAIKQQSDYAKSLENTEDNANKATKAVNSYKRSVLGFDELHKITENNTSDSSVADTLDNDSVKLENIATQATAVNKLADNLRKAFKAGNFAGFGKQIANAVNSAFAWLDKTIGWNKNAEKFTKTLNNIVSGINGFVSGLKSQQIGKTIADVINTVIESFKMLTDPISGIDFMSIGTTFGTMLISAFSNIHWENLGATIVQTIQNGVTALNGFLTSTIVNSVTGEEVSVSTAIGRALSNMFTGAIGALDPGAWGDLFANLVNGITGFITSTFSDTSNIVTLTEKLGDAINTAVSKIDADQLAEAVTVLAGAFVDVFNSIFNSIDWSSVWDLLYSTLSSEKLDWSKVIQALGIIALPSLIVSTLVSGLSSLGSVIASSAATIASSPVVLTAVAAAFGVSGAIYGISQLPAGIEKAIEDTKAVSDSLSELDKMGKFEGGNFQAAWATYQDSSKVIADTTGQYVSFAGSIITAQDYVDRILTESGKAEQMAEKYDGGFVFVNDEMTSLAYKLVEQGNAVIETSDAFEDDLIPGLMTASDGFEALNKGLNNAAASLNNHMPDGTHATIPHFANGGVVGDGQLFIANEGRVSELITSDGAGNTAIVNNEQIISAVISGVRQSVLEAAYTIVDKLADNESGNSGDIVLNVDSVELARATARGQRQIDRRGNHSVSFA